MGILSEKYSLFPVLFFSFTLLPFSYVAKFWTVQFRRKPSRESFFSKVLARSFVFLFYSFPLVFRLFLTFSCVLGLCPKFGLDALYVLYCGASICFHRGH